MFSKLKNRIIDRYGSQSHFAESVNIPKSSLSRYLSGQTSIDTATLTKMIDSLEIPEAEIDSYFFTATPEPNLTEKRTFDTSALRSRILGIFGSYKNFAEALNVSSQSVCNRLKGTTQFTLDDIDLWSRTLKIDTTEIDDYFFRKER